MPTEDHDMDSYSLLLPFDTDAPEFARGFEAGRLWALLREREEPFSETVHAANAEMIIRMCERTGRTVAGEDLGGEWMELSFGPAEERELEDA